MDELVTLAEVARRVGLSRQRVQQLAQRSDFPTRQRIGNAWAVEWSDADEWFAQRVKGKGGRPRTRTSGDRS